MEQKHLTYLDGLRESGETNMWGAGIYLVREFALSKEEANKILTYWMVNFNFKGTKLKDEGDRKQ